MTGIDRNNFRGNFYALDERKGQTQARQMKNILNNPPSVSVAGNFKLTVSDEVTKDMGSHEKVALENWLVECTAAINKQLTGRDPGDFSITNRYEGVDELKLMTSIKLSMTRFTVMQSTKFGYKVIGDAAVMGHGHSIQNLIEAVLTENALLWKSTCEFIDD